MRREGRQHGLVRTRAVQPRPGSRVINRLTSPPTAGVFTTAPSKPTNHSKFTARCVRQACGDCHAVPTSKSRGKAKGERKAVAAAGTTALAIDSELGRYGEDSAKEVVRRMVGSRSDDYYDDNDWSSDDDNGFHFDIQSVWSVDSFDYDMFFPVISAEQQLRYEFADHMERTGEDQFEAQLDRVARDPGGRFLAAAVVAATMADVDDWCLVAAEAIVDADDVDHERMESGIL